MHKESGFTLIELLVVISLIGIMAGIGTLGMRGVLAHYRLKTGVYTLVSDLRTVKQLAINKQVRHGIKFNITNRRYKLFNDTVGEFKTKMLNQELDYDSVNFGGDQEVTFKAIGTADNGSLKLINSNNQTYKIIVSGTGRIRVEQME